MYTHDVIQIVDVYGLYAEGRKKTLKSNPDEEAQSLSILTKPLGRDCRKIAIVARDDYGRLLAYQREGYEIITMDPNRSAELRQFIRQMVAQIKQVQPKHLVLVSDEVEFIYLCEAVLPYTNLSVWAHSATVPRELTEPSFGFRPLEELLPNLKIPRIDVRIDIENILAGLLNLGWRPNMREMIEAIRKAMDDLGEIVALTGYADWSKFNRHLMDPKIDWQRELILAGGDSRYVINQHGKNTSDMKIADDIRTVVEQDHAAWGLIDIICLVTMDSDFSPVVDTARIRGKKVVVLGLESTMSRALESAASEVRYLNSFLKLEQSSRQEKNPIIPKRRHNAPLMVQGIDQSISPPTIRPLRVFLCHSKNDKAAVQTLYQRLANDGIDPWLDEEKILPGKKWDREIRLAVRASDVVIVCLSKGSISKTGYVQKEIQLALDEADKKPEGSIFVIPVKLEECDVPDRLSQWQWVSLFEEKGYEKLLLGLNNSINKADQWE